MMIEEPVKGIARVRKAFAVESARKKAQALAKASATVTTTKPATPTPAPARRPTKGIRLRGVMPRPTFGKTLKP
jgi:hypothetical protein